MRWTSMRTIVMNDEVLPPILKALAPCTRSLFATRKDWSWSVCRSYQQQPSCTSYSQQSPAPRQTRPPPRRRGSSRALWTVHSTKSLKTITLTLLLQAQRPHVETKSHFNSFVCISIRKQVGSAPRKLAQVAFGSSRVRIFAQKASIQMCFVTLLEPLKASTWGVPRI